MSWTSITKENHVHIKTVRIGWKIDGETEPVWEFDVEDREGR